MKRLLVAALLCGGVWCRAVEVWDHLKVGRTSGECTQAVDWTGALSLNGGAALDADADGRIDATVGGLDLNTSASTGVASVAAGTWSVAATLANSLGGTGQNSSAWTGVPSVSAGTWSAAATLVNSLGGTGQNSSAWTGVPSVSGGTWSAAATLAASLGGTGLNTSAATGVPYVSAGTWATETTLATSRGGLALDTSGSTGIAKCTAGTWSVAALSAGTDYVRTGVYRTIWIDAGACIARTTNGMDGTGSPEEYATNDVMSDFFAADAATDEAVQARVAMPDEWDLGTVKAKVYWTTGTAGGSVVWGVRGQAVSNDDAIDASWGTAQTVTDAVIATGDLHVTAATAAITIGGTPAFGDAIWLEVYRDADHGSDDNAGDAKLLGVLLQYRENSTEASAW